MKLIYILFFQLAFSNVLIAQDASTTIAGVWKNGEGTGHIEIYKTTSGHYAGKIIWLKEPLDVETGKPKLDKRNPDKSKRILPLLGLIMLRGFTYDADDKEWNGHIYDPKNGKNYSCKASLKDANTLRVRGYLGISLLGRSDTWTRIK